MGIFTANKKKLFPIILCFSACSMVCQSNIHVNTIGVNPANCSHLNCSSCSCTVCDLSAALAQLQECGSNTNIIISQGIYNLTNSSLVYFRWLNNVAIVGIGKVKIECDTGVGLTFEYSSNITLENITFLYCGKEQTSSSLSFSEATTTSYITFTVALYMLYCADLRLININIESSNGTGVQIYGTVGTNFFINCNFSKNRVSNGGPGGGGLYIEFPFCSPGDLNCVSGFTNVSELWSSNSSYLIQNCVFESNFATSVSNLETTFVPYAPGGRNNQAFARGGGVSIFFKGNATNNTITVKQCHFINNVAAWGSGLFVEFQDLCTKNHLNVEDSVFLSNYCEGNVLFDDTGTAGGGARIGFIYYDPYQVSKNDVVFERTRFENNSAYWGGGVSFYTARERSIDATNGVKFTNCHWIRNRGRIGSAVDLMLWHQSIEGVVMTLQFDNSSFTGNHNNVEQKWVSSSVGFGTFFTDSIPVNFSGQVGFMNNSESAVIGIAAALSFVPNCTASFSNNSGRYGGALQLLAYAFIQLYDYAMITFESNSASYEGGAIYSEGIGEQDTLTATTVCFIRFYDINVGPNNWTIQVNFFNNSNYKTNNSIYATSIAGCRLGGAYGPSIKNLSIPFCWGPAWNYSGQNCSDEIKSGVSSINVGTFVTYPGNNIYLPISLLDDFNSNIATPQVLGVTIVSNDVVQITNRYTTDNTATFVGPVNSDAICRVETSDPTLYIDFNITMQNCPPGYNFENSTLTCNCSETSYNGLVKCSSTGPTIQNGAWIGNISNDSIELYYVGYSPYLIKPVSLQYSKVNDTCNRNRVGVLCAECTKGYAPAFNDATFPCVECNDASVYNWLIWLLVEYIPLTILFIIVVIFHVNVTSGSANAFIFFAQMFVMTSPETASDNAISRIFFIIYNCANLNFYFGQLTYPRCLSEQIQGLEFISMKYLEALYPILLLLITYALLHLYENGVQPVFFIFHPIHKCFARIKRTINLRSSVIDGFATFLVLAYAKIAFVSFYVLVPTSLYSYNGSVQETRLYYVGNVAYLSTEHIPFFCLSLAILTIFIILPPLFLLLYPLKIFRKGLGLVRLSSCYGTKCSHFLDTFHGCFKNGTNGTRDCRYFSGFYLIYRLALLLCLLEKQYFKQFVIMQLVLLAIAVSFVVLRPYANDIYNSLDATMIVIMVAANTLELYIDNNNFLTANASNEWAVALKHCLVFLPLLYMLIFVMYTMWSACNLSNSKLVQQIKKLFGFSRAQSIYDEQLHYEDEFLNTMDRFVDGGDTEPLLEQDRFNSEFQYGTI